MSTGLFILMAWGIHTVLAAVLLAPILYLARNEVGWRRWESLGLVVPFCCWFALMLSGMVPKSLSNFVVEPGVLSLGVAVGAITRVAITSWTSDKIASTLTFIGLCFVGVAVYWIVPILPE